MPRRLASPENEKNHFDDAAWIHCHRNLRLLARLHGAHFILLIDGQNSLLVPDESHRGLPHKTGRLGQSLGDLGLDLCDFVLIALGSFCSLSYSFSFFGFGRKRPDAISSTLPAAFKTVSRL